MMKTIDTSKLDQLSVEQRLELIDQLWATLIDEDPELPLDPEELAEMQRRANELRANPQSGVSEQEMLKRLRSLK